MQLQTLKSSSKRVWLRLVTFSVAGLAAASATFWVLRLSNPGPVVQGSPPVQTSPFQASPQAVAVLLGSAQSAVAAKNEPIGDPSGSRFKLMGVVAERRAKGIALIAIDGKPAKPFRVGAQVDEALVLQSVAPRSATLAARLDAQAQVTLDLPKLTTP